MEVILYMSRLVKHKIRRKMNNLSGGGYEAAINDAKRQLSAINLRAAQLREVIANFKRLKRSGHPWPGDHTT